MAKNKIIFGGKVLIDLTGDTVIPEALLSGYTSHDREGNIIPGECTFDSDTSDATMTENTVLQGQTGYARGQKVVGNMPNNGAVTGYISSKNEKFTIPPGFHDGSGKVGIDEEELKKIIGGNIKKGVNILGQIGEYGGESINTQEKTVTPSTSKQVINPDAGYDYLSSITVNPIPYVETANSAGGTTVSIG